MTARENPAYPATGQACYRIGGTRASLELPALKLWHDDERRDWMAPISATVQPQGLDDPLVLQIRQFAGDGRQHGTDARPWPRGPEGPRRH